MPIFRQFIGDLPDCLLGGELACINDSRQQVGCALQDFVDERLGFFVQLIAIESDKSRGERYQVLRLSFARHAGRFIHGFHRQIPEQNLNPDVFAQKCDYRIFRIRNSGLDEVLAELLDDRDLVHEKAARIGGQAF